MAGKKQLPPVTIAPKDSEESRLDRLRGIRRVLEAHIFDPKTLARDLTPQMPVSYPYPQMCMFEEVVADGW